MRISIVTPSFNQVRFLETCLKSVLTQGASDLEYFVMDGGSTDGSAEVILKYANALTEWRSHPDEGHMQALKEGFEHSTGEIMGWLNSDDQLAPWALRTVEAIFTAFPQVEWLTTRYPMMMDERGIVIRTRRLEGFHPQAFFRGRNVPLNPLFFSGFIQQESTFWRRSLWEKAGGFVDKSFRLAGDFELWSRFFLHASLYAVAVPLGIFRFQPGAYTANEMHNYLDVCRRVLSTSNVQPPRQMECRVRRGLRLLPHAVRRFTGLAYSAPIIDHGGRNGNWMILRDWFV